LHCAVAPAGGPLGLEYGEHTVLPSEFVYDPFGQLGACVGGDVAGGTYGVVGATYTVGGGTYGAAVGGVVRGVVADDCGAAVGGVVTAAL
jgi:hypothetical protein